MWDFQKSAWIIWTSYNHQCYRVSSTLIQEVTVHGAGDPKGAQVCPGLHRAGAAGNHLIWRSKRFTKEQTLVFVPLTNRLREVGRWKTWQCLSSAQPAVTEHRLGGLQTTDIELQLWRPDSKIKAPPGASRAKLPALWDEAGVTRPQHTAQNHIRTQIQHLNTDISEDPEHRFSIQKKEFNVSKINPHRSDVERTLSNLFTKNWF